MSAPWSQPADRHARPLHLPALGAPALAASTRRCHDHQCGSRHRCERWLQRGDARPTQHPRPVLHAMTLKHGSIPHEDPCAHIIRHRMSPADLPLKGRAGWFVLAWYLGVAPAKLAGRLLSDAAKRRPAPKPSTRQHSTRATEDA